MRFYLIPLMLIFMVFAVPVSAAPQKPNLKQVESDLQKQKESEKKLHEQQQDIESKLDQLQKELMSMAPDLQGHERAMMKLQTRREDTEKQIEEAQGNLEKQHESLAQLVVALQRLNRMPPQALLARPSAPVDMARSFELLQKVIPAVSEKAGEVKKLFTELSELRSTLVRQEQELAEEKIKLEKKQTRLDKVVKERLALLKKTQGQKQEASRKVAALSAQARDLRDLMHKLDAQEKATPAPAKSIAKTLKQWFSGGGKPGTLPVSGSVVTGYGARLPSGSTSQGLSIKAAPGAIVTSPSAGTVRFAGPFRQYKLLVIIQHSNGEHSLLGGLQELYTTLGSRVAAGEPIGKLPNAKLVGDSNHAASLYYERRRGGKPIDPRRARG